MRACARAEAAATGLRALDMFKPLPIATVENLAARSTSLRVDEGQEVIRQGDYGDTFT